MAAIFRISTGETMKKCSTCKEIKDDSEFHKNKSTSTGLANECKTCKAKYQREHPEIRAVQLQRFANKRPYFNFAYHSLKNHRLSGYNIFITVEELERFVNGKEGRCEICGLQLDFGYGTKNGRIQKTSPTLDRKFNENDISIDNIMLLCSRCNASKQDRGIKEFAEYCKMVTEKFACY